MIQRPLSVRRAAAASLSQARSGAGRWWLWPNLLSLDAPLVAVVWLWAFAKSVRIELPAEDYLLLGLAVWTIYVADRLLDVMRMPDLERAPVRHWFYARHAGAFLVGGTIAAVSGLTLALATLPPTVWWSGAAVGLAAGLYLQLPSRFWLPKELCIGILFSLGTLCALAGNLGAKEGVAAGLYALLCAANCVAIGQRERESDRVNDPAALPCRAPWLAARLPWLLAALMAGGLMLGGGLGVAIGLAAGALWVLHACEGKVSGSLFRVLADAALLSPLVVMLLGGL